MKQQAITIRHKSSTRVTTLAQAVRVARANLGLTQRDLAASVGVEASHIAYIESAQRHPSLAVLLKLCDALHLPKRAMALLAWPDLRKMLG